MKKIGVIGGTFDPVHRGHISLATDAIKQAGLDEVLFMPAKKQPFKREKEVTSAEDRIAMLSLALEYVDGCSITTVEMDREGLSYTYKSLQELKKEMGEEAEIYFILGTDSYIKLGIWKNSETLLEESSFIVGHRPGYLEDELEECKRLYQETFKTKTIVIDNLKLDISSTEIRDKVNKGLPVVDMVPEGVVRYIYENKLYRG